MIEINKIYNEDCLKGMIEIADKSVDMIFCDLPYGTTKCKWDVIIDFDKLWKQYKRIIKKDGAIVLTAKQPFTSKLINSNINNFKEIITWIKHKPTNFANGKYRHLNYTEDVVVFSYGSPTYNPIMVPRSSNRVREAQRGKSLNWRTSPRSDDVAFSTNYNPRTWDAYDPGYKYPCNYIQIPSVVSNSKEKLNHRTQKPLRLVEYFIKTYSNEGDTVLDNCMGSGTTAIACINSRRNFIGFELDEEYFNMSIERINSVLSPTGTIRAKMNKNKK